MERLHNEFEALTEDGTTLETELDYVLKRLFKKYHARGFSIRDIVSIAINSCTATGAEMQLIAAVKQRKTK